MEEADWLAERFEEHRDRLRGVAYRMLGSLTEADDAVQDAWLRLNRPNADKIENLGGWLTTVVSRICLNTLRSRKIRSEDPIGVYIPDPIVTPDLAGGTRQPEQEALLAESVGLALIVVLDTLTPAERLAFVLHDLFGLPFDEIAPMVDRTPAATRQLASRARRRVRELGPPCPPRTPTTPSSGGWSTPSSSPPAAVTSTPWSLCWTPTSSCAPTAALPDRRPRPWSAEQRPSPAGRSCSPSPPRRYSPR